MAAWPSAARSAGGSTGAHWAVQRQRGLHQNAPPESQLPPWLRKKPVSQGQEL